MAAAALLAGGCDVQVGEKGFSLDIAEGKVTDEWVRTYTLPAGGTLEIVNVNGEIEASAADGREVEVRARREVRTYSENTAQEALRNVRMREDISWDRVAIEALVGSDDDGSWHGPWSPLSVTYHVRVPAGLTVSFKTEQGRVRLENLSGRITASTTNGGITGSGLSGAVTARVVNGGVQLDLASIVGDVSVSTTNGGVRLDLPRDAKATLEATCVNGGIDVDDKLTLETSESSRRRVVATLNGGGHRISAATVNGGIRIRSRESD